MLGFTPRMRPRSGLTRAGTAVPRQLCSGRGPGGAVWRSATAKVHLGTPSPECRSVSWPWEGGCQEQGEGLPWNVEPGARWTEEQAVSDGTLHHGCPCTPRSSRLGPPQGSRWARGRDSLGGRGLMLGVTVPGPHRSYPSSVPASVPPRAALEPGPQRGWGCSEQSQGEDAETGVGGSPSDWETPCPQQALWGPSIPCAPRPLCPLPSFAFGLNTCSMCLRPRAVLTCVALGVTGRTSLRELLALAA